MSEQTKETKKNLAVIEKNITDQVLVKIKTLSAAKMLRLPKDYSPENALKGAWIILQDVKDKNGKLALEICSPDSIALSLLKMTTEGLSPLKKQGSFIVRDGKLYWDREYDGDVALAKRAGLLWINDQVIYEGDKYITKIDERGIKNLVSHEQPIENIDNNKIKGAYVVYEVEGEGIKLLEMTMNEIRTSWNQGPMKGQSPAHKNFPADMAKRTVIRKACKPIHRRADDSDLFYEDDKNKNDAYYELANEEINENANKKEISFDDVEEVVEEQPKIERIDDSETKKEELQNSPNKPIEKPIDNPQQGEMFGNKPEF